MTQGTGTSCHHCCSHWITVTRDYWYTTDARQGLPSWFGSSGSFILPNPGRQSRALGEARSLGHCCLRLVPLFSGRQDVTLTPAVQAKTSLPSWTTYQWGCLGSAFCVAPPELQAALCLWQLHLHHGINRKAKPLHVFITPLITLKRNSVYQALSISKTCTCHILHSRRGFQPFHILMWWIALCYWATLRSYLGFRIKSLTTAALRREKRSIREIHRKISFCEWGESNFVSKGADLSCVVCLFNRLLSTEAFLGRYR